MLQLSLLIYTCRKACVKNGNELYKQTCYFVIALSYTSIALNPSKNSSLWKKF